MSRRSTYAATGLLALFLAACPPASDEGEVCSRDDECLDVCSPVGECIDLSTSLDIRLSWTIGGQAPSPTQAEVCAAIADFEVRFESNSERDDVIAYFPVPCENGTIFYPNMPSRLVQVRLTAVDANGDVLETQVRELAELDSNFSLDFNP